MYPKQQQHNLPAAKKNVEAEQNPRKVFGLEASTKPETDNCFLVELTPDVNHRQDEWVHQQH